MLKLYSGEELRRFYAVDSLCSKRSPLDWIEDYFKGYYTPTLDMVICYMWCVKHNKDICDVNSAFEEFDTDVAKTFFETHLKGLKNEIQTIL